MIIFCSFYHFILPFVIDSFPIPFILLFVIDSFPIPTRHFWLMHIYVVYKIRKNTYCSSVQVIFNLYGHLRCLLCIYVSFIKNKTTCTKYCLVPQSHRMATLLRSAKSARSPLIVAGLLWNLMECRSSAAGRSRVSKVAEVTFKFLTCSKQVQWGDSRCRLP